MAAFNLKAAGDFAEKTAKKVGKAGKRTAKRAGKIARRNADKVSALGERTAKRAGKIARRNTDKVSELGERTAKRAGKIAKRNVRNVEKLGGRAAKGAGKAADAMASMVGSNKAVKALRAEVARVGKVREHYAKQIKDMQKSLDSVNDDAGLLTLQLQVMVQRMTQAEQMSAQVMKKFNDAATAIIRNI